MIAKLGAKIKIRAFFKKVSKILAYVKNYIYICIIIKNIYKMSKESIEKLLELLTDEVKQIELELPEKDSIGQMAVSIGKINGINLAIRAIQEEFKIQ